jgi:uncharacterized metal-binding protein YceD (DUF177 family)
MADEAWPRPLKLAELAHGEVTRRLAADSDTRQRIAGELGLDGLERLDAEISAAPWLDGARVWGRLRARVRQTCGVTLEPLESEIDHDFELKLLPAGSPNAPAGPEETVLDPDAEDPPELIEDDRIDLGALVVEQLALEIDPFPRKPGAVFDAGPEENPPSPFAVLKDFKPRRG